MSKATKPPVDRLAKLKARVPEPYREHFVFRVGPELVHLVTHASDPLKAETRSLVEPFVVEQARRYGYQRYAVFPRFGRMTEPLWEGAV